MRGPQDTSLDTLLEAAILEKVERVAEALSSGKEGIDAKQAADFLSISESEFKRMAPRLPRHAVTERSGATSTCGASSSHGSRGVNKRLGDPG